jgi:hypothetical protein
MRVVPFLLLTIVFAIAVGNYLNASTGTVDVPEKAATAITATSATLMSKGAAPEAATPSARSRPINLVAAAAASPSSVACVHRADGATVCGPVLESGNKTTPNIFDQPAITRSIAPLQPAVARPAQNRKAGTIKFVAITPKQVPTPPIPHQHKPRAAQRSANENTSQTHLERDHGPASRFDHKTRAPSTAGETRRLQNDPEQSPAYAERRGPAPAYDAERDAAFHRKPPAQYSAGNLRRFEAERIAERSGATPRYGDNRGLPPWFESQRPQRGADSRYGAGRSPFLTEREPPRKRERPPMVAERQGAAPPHDDEARRGPAPQRTHRPRNAQFADFEHRTLQLERELRSLRAERADELRRVERLDSGKRPYAKSSPSSGQERLEQPDWPASSDRKL